MNFNARQYDPQIGRFLSIDPLAYVGGQQVHSPYAAMGNNPGMMVDPNGTNPGYATIDYRSDELIGPSADEMWLQETGNNVSANIPSTNSNYSINAIDVNSYHYSEAEREYAIAALQSAILAGISVMEGFNFDFGSRMDMNRWNGVQSASYDNYYPEPGHIASVNGWIPPPRKVDSDKPDVLPTVVFNGKYNKANIQKKSYAPALSLILAAGFTQAASVAVPVVGLVVVGIIIWENRDAIRDGVTAAGQTINDAWQWIKGERGWQGKSQNTDNPYKKWRKNDKDYDTVFKPDGKGGYNKTPKPDDWDIYKRPDGGNKSRKK